MAFVNDITEKMLVQRELLEHKRNLERIIELRTEELNKNIIDLKLHKAILDSHSSVSITDVNGKIIYVNDLMTKVSGYSRTELVGGTHRILKSGVHDERFFKEMYQTILNGKTWKGEMCNKAKDGHLYWLDVTIVPQLSLSGTPLRYFSIRTDISQTKNALITIQEKEEELRALLDNATDGIHLVNQRGGIVKCSLAFAKMLGYHKSEILKLKIWQIDELVTSEQLINKVNELSSKEQIIETRHKRKDGSYLDVEVMIKLIRLQGEVLIYCSSRDITERLNAQHQMQYLAQTDQLTKVANRHKFIEYANYLIVKSSRMETKLALVFIDLDKFKGVNDSYGHTIGDEVLKKAAEILLKNCREYDLVSRIGGDEFAVLLVDVDEKRVKHYATSVLQAMNNETFKSNDTTFSTHFSIGISLYPSHGKNIAELMKSADLALYEVKKTGRGNYRMYSP